MTPRKPEDFANIRKKSKQSIIKAATKIFAKYGFHNASIVNIAEKANISKGLIYHYFDSKDDLLQSIFSQGFPFFDEILKIDNKDINAIGKIEILLDNFVKSLQDNFEFWKLYQSIVSNPTVSHRLDDFKKYYESVFSPLLFSIFSELYDNKDSVQIQTEVLLFAALMDGVAFDFIIIGEKYPLEAIKKNILKKYKSMQK